MIYDTHVHSTFSADGKSTLDDYAALLKKGGLLGIGFAEHVDFLPECGSYGYLDSGEYLERVKTFRDMGCGFYAGGEIDYDEGVEKDILEHLARYHYDFTICSVHMIDGISVSDRICIPSIKDRGLLAGIIEKYYKAVVKTIKAGCFDVVGHLGVYRRYLDREYLEDPRLKSLAMEAEREIAGLCVQSGMILEVNTSGLFSPLAETLPGKPFLELYKSLGGGSVSVGSDAHDAGSCGKGVSTALRLLRDIGFEHVILPWDWEHPVSIVRLQL